MEIPDLDNFCELCNDFLSAYHIKKGNTLCDLCSDKRRKGKKTKREKEYEIL